MPQMMNVVTKIAMHLMLFSLNFSPVNMPTTMEIKSGIHMKSHGMSHMNVIATIRITFTTPAPTAHSITFLSFILKRPPHIFLPRIVKSVSFCDIDSFHHHYTTFYIRLQN